MATRLHKTVMPSGQGGDYTSLEAALNDNEQNLVTADKYFDCDICGDWSAASDTTTVTYHNYTTNSTHYVKVYTSGSARNTTGKWSTSHYRLIINGTAITQNNSDYLWIDGLQIEVTDSGGGNAIYATGNYANDLKVSNCILWASTNEGGGSGIHCHKQGTWDAFYNNIIYGWDNHANYSHGITAMGAKYYNNTIYDIAGKGINRWASGTADCQNNIVMNTGGVTFSDCSGDYNLDDDGNAPGANSIHNKVAADQFVSLTGGDEDFNLKEGADAIDVGTDLGSPYDVDNAGNTRSDPWDMGALEYITAGWAHKISGVSSPAKVNTVENANINKINTVEA